MPIRVIITDDHLLLIKGIKEALEADKDIEVTGTYTSGAQLLSALSHQQPDVLLLDVHLPDNTGSDLAIRILKQYPNQRILILSGEGSVFQIREMLQQGCMGYLLKSTTNQPILVEAVKEVASGNLFLDPSLKDQVLNLMIREQKPQNNTPKKLTRRETEILQFIVDECSTQEIADKLFLSPRTVENHRFNILQKLGAKNTVALVKIALQMGLKE